MCFIGKKIEIKIGDKFNKLTVVGEAEPTISEWSRRSGVQPATIRRRLKNGWTGEDLISQPYANRKKNAK